MKGLGGSLPGVDAGVNIMEEEQGEEELQEAEITKALNKMKKRKAAGIDGIPMEAWKYGGKSLWKRMKNLRKQIWKARTIPKDWKKGIVVPLYKRGDKKIVGNYRGISLLCTAYKIYAEVIGNRLEMEVEERGIVPTSQAGKEDQRWTIYLF
ncbi:uncharacterized protein LOC105203975 [Solenopsis invicta]|uniref:uncharacterized protein LOC105203975 n=1 Tax=Solenopsis invicta TaxID=13686 RepID=UPI000595A9F5|nr:uncharacterized protein LOC105203975 [Solenopsis invicta]